MTFLSASKLSRVDRLVLLVTLTYGIVGSILTLLMMTPGRSDNTHVLMATLGIAVLVGVLLALLYGSRRGSISLSQCGFSLGGGMWVNLGLVLVCTALIIRQLPATRLSFTGSTFWAIVAAFTEELVFRVYLIRILAILICPRKGHVTWAVLLSAVTFAALHAFRAPGSLLLGIFFSSVIFGYVTYFTRSLLFAAYYHILSNTGPEVGLFGGCVAVGAYLVISLYSSLRRTDSLPTLKSVQR